VLKKINHYFYKKLSLTLESFPTQYALEELIDKFILLDKIDRGNQQSENGETISEVKIEMQKWFK
jgi:hypothetical protein